MEVPSYADMVRALTRLLKPDGLLVLVEAELSFVSGPLMPLTPGLCKRRAGARRRQVVCGRPTRHRRDGQLDVIAIPAAARRLQARCGYCRNGLIVSIALTSLHPPDFSALSTPHYS